MQEYEQLYTYFSRKHVLPGERKTVKFSLHPLVLEKEPQFRANNLQEIGETLWEK